jgi:hypothetical protein
MGIIHSTAEIGSIVQEVQSPKDMSNTIWLPKLAPLENQPSTVSDFLAEKRQRQEKGKNCSLNWKYDWPSTGLLQGKSSPDQSNHFHLISWVATEAITKLYLR